MTKTIPDNEAFDALRKIKQAEESARGIVQEAREKTSPKIIQEALEEAEKIKAQFLIDARGKADNKKREIIEKATRERESIQQESEKEITELRRKAKTRMPETVEKIRKEMEKVLMNGEL